MKKLLTTLTALAILSGAAYAETTAPAKEPVKKPAVQKQVMKKHHKKSADCKCKKEMKKAEQAPTANEPVKK